MSWVGRLRHFHPESDVALGDPAGDLMDERLMDLLDQAREEAGVPFRVTSGFRSVAGNIAAGGERDSAHLLDRTGHALAVDGYFEGWPLDEQLLHVMRFPFFGVGIYPYQQRPSPHAWTPVLHVDRKDRGKRYGEKVVWIRNAEGVYVYWPGADFRAELRAIVRGQR